MFTPKKKVNFLRENRIEKRLKDEIKKIGGKALKFVSPGVSGVPDRIVLLPHGKIFFIELKAPGEKLKPLQVHRAKELIDLGFNVRCLDSIESVLQFISEVQNEI